MRARLPPDLVAVVCEDVAASRDFYTLSQLCFVNRSTGSLAVRELWSIFEQSPISADGSSNIESWARMWKALVLSTMGKTVFPYCSYIKELPLGNLEDMLDSLNSSDAILIRNWVFNPAQGMDRFLVLREYKNQMTRSATKRRLPTVDAGATAIVCGEAIIRRIMANADQTKATVTLARLETKQLPNNLFPLWVTKLQALTSLQVHHGAMLGAQAGSAISAYCPKFSEFRCYDCSGPNADEDMATFLLTLRPNTLQRFEVISRNDIGKSVMTALTAHAETLTSLKLGGISINAMKNLNILALCKGLVTLHLENDRASKFKSKLHNNDWLREIVDWISGLEDLTELSLTDVFDAVPIVNSVCASRVIHLESLTVQGFGIFYGSDSERPFKSLGRQVDLEHLCLGHHNTPGEGYVAWSLNDGGYWHLHKAISGLSALKTLDLGRVDCPESLIWKILSGMEEPDKRDWTVMPDLTDLSLGGDDASDFTLERLPYLVPRLKSLVMHADSKFTYEALEEFAKQLSTFGHHYGIRVDIINQSWRYKLRPDELQRLTDYFATRLGGEFRIAYQQDPDELHESDFTAESD